MDSSVAIAAAYLQLDGYFVLTELPVRIVDRHGYRTAAELVPDRHAHARDPLLGQDALKELVHAS